MSRDQVPFPHIVIRASAGTGKTFQLSNRFLGLSAGGRRQKRAATVEIARRGRHELAHRLVRDSDAVAQRERSCHLRSALTTRGA